MEATVNIAQVLLSVLGIALASFAMGYSVSNIEAEKHIEKTQELFKKLQRQRDEGDEERGAGEK